MGGMTKEWSQCPSLSQANLNHLKSMGDSNYGCRTRFVVRQLPLPALQALLRADLATAVQVSVLGWRPCHSIVAANVLPLGSSVPQAHWALLALFPSTCPGTRPRRVLPARTQCLTEGEALQLRRLLIQSIEVKHRHQWGTLEKA